MSDTSKRAVPWLQESAEKRRIETVKKLTDAMRAIELDIQANDNLYPFNGGAVTQAEVCRRASVKNTLLQAPSHKDSTKKMVDIWVAEIKNRFITGRKNVRKTVTARVEDWKQQHEYLRNSYHIDMLKLEGAEAKLRELEKEIELLHQQNEALRAELSKERSNVHALKPKTRS